MDNMLNEHFVLFITFDVIVKHLMRIAILENAELEIEFHPKKMFKLFHKFDGVL